MCRTKLVIVWINDLDNLYVLCERFYRLEILLTFLLQFNLKFSIFSLFEISSISIFPVYFLRLRADTLF